MALTIGVRFVLGPAENAVSGYFLFAIPNRSRRQRRRHKKSFCDIGSWTRLLQSPNLIRNHLNAILKMFYITSDLPRLEAGLQKDELWLEKPFSAEDEFFEIQVWDMWAEAVFSPDPREEKLGERPEQTLEQMPRDWTWKFQSNQRVWSVSHLLYG